MIMSIDEHTTKLEKALADLAKTQVQDCLLTTLDMIGFVKLRLAENGGNASGGQFTDYSPIYAKKRAEKGLQKDFKDFNVTGQLYASIQPEIKAVELGKVEVSIVPRGADNQAKIAGQLNRDGNILEPSPAEIKDATDAHTRRRLDRAKQIFG